METRNELRQLLNTLNTEQTKAAIEIIQSIASGDGIKIHLSSKSDKYYINISNVYLKITSNDDDLGPKEQHILTDIPYEFSVTKILNNYITTYGTIYRAVPECVLKGSNEVLFGGGDLVVFKNFIFRITYLGSVSKLYATDEDYLNETNPFCIATRKLQKVIPIETLDNELAHYTKTHSSMCH